MDVSIGPDQQLLVETAARFAADVATTTTHALPPVDGASLEWRVLAETGFVGLHLPDDVGGGGGTAVDVALVAEQLAGALATVPFIGQAVLGPELLLAGGASAQDLALVLAGERRVTVLLDPSLRRIARAGEAAIAFDAAGADAAVALGADGGAVIVELDAAAPSRNADLTRVLRSIEVPAGLPSISGTIDADALVRFEALALAVVAADLVGVMQRALDEAVAYVRDRVQFGVPVGSFQAVQHMAADAKVWLEGSRGSMWHGAWAVDALGAADALLAARQAKAFCAPAARDVVETMVQMLGGIAITWEELAHVRVRRVLLDRLCFGDEGHQYDAIAATRVGAES